MATDTKRVTILVPEDKFKILEKYAQKEYRTISSYFLEWLDEFINLKEKGLIPLISTITNPEDMDTITEKEWKEMMGLMLTAIREKLSEETKKEYREVAEKNSNLADK